MTSMDPAAIARILSDNLIHSRATLTIRPEQPRDAPALLAAAQADRACDYAAFGLDADRTRDLATRQWQAQRRHHAALGGHAFVVDAGADACVGHLCLAAPPAQPWRLIDFGIRADRRGCGLGGAVLHAMRHAAIGAGSPGIELSVGVDNPRAAALYRRSGYVDVTQDVAPVAFRAMRLALA